MPKLINTHLPGQALVRLFHLKGHYQPVLDETIVPVVIVGGEEESPRKLAAGGTSAAAAGVGNQNQTMFENPTLSGHLIVLTRIWAVSGAGVTDIFNILPVDNSPGNTGIGSWRDDRNVGRPHARTGATTPATIVLGYPNYPCSGIPLEVEYVMAPGNHLRIRQQAANQTLTVQLEWYELVLPAGPRF